MTAVACDPAGTADDAVAAHSADTTAVHGIADTSLLETAAGAQAKANAAQAAAIAASDPAGSAAAAQSAAEGYADSAVAAHDADADAHGGALPQTWLEYASNPIVGLVTGASTLTTFGDVVFDSDTSLFHLFAMVDAPGAYGVYEMTSADGLSFNAAQAVLVLGLGSETWENSTVGVPTVWKEGSTWYMLYAATGTGHSQRQIGLATRAASSGAFSRAQATPVITDDAAFLSNAGAETGPGRVIKVGSTYYAFVSNIGGVGRVIGVYTSTNLTSWTSDSANPIFTGGRFCNSVWLEGGVYYSLMPRYRAVDRTVDFELWRSTTPQFYAKSRSLLGVFYRSKVGLTPAVWDTASADTPVVVCDTINRNSYACTGGVPRVYYAGQDNTGKWKMGLMLPQAAKQPVGVDVQSVSMIGPWAQAALPANQPATMIYLVGGGTTFKNLVMPYSGSIVSIAIYSDTNCTAGTCTAVATGPTGVSLGISTGLEAVTNKSVNTASVQPGQIPFLSGARIGVTLASSAAWAPTSANITVAIGVVFDMA